MENLKNPPTIRPENENLNISVCHNSGLSNTTVEVVCLVEGSTLYFDILKNFNK